ncbi:hypothetical protein C3L33_21940, partial [Rhododendron williamsianum]
MSCFSPSKKKSEFWKGSSQEVRKGKEHNLRAFSFSKLETATDDFKTRRMIGVHRHGCVYKGTIRHPMAKKVVVIRRFIYDQDSKEWLAKVQFLDVVDHPNLVKLLGASTTLPWKTRLEIILSAAQGLAYLHASMEIQ